MKNFRVTYRSGPRRIAININGASTAIQAAIWAADRIVFAAQVPRSSLHLVSVEGKR